MNKKKKNNQSLTPPNYNKTKIILNRSRNKSKKRSKTIISKKDKNNKKKVNNIILQKDEIINEDPNTQFIIEKILGRCFMFDNKIKKIYYRVKWSNYDYSYNTWESLEGLIEDNVFESIFEYENKSINEKINLIKKYKKLDKFLNEVTEKNIKESENVKEIIEFKNDFVDFNPKFRECFNKCEFGNLNDDEIEKISFIQDNINEGIRIKCEWKIRKGEINRRKERYYKPKIIAILKNDEENKKEINEYKEAFSQFDKYAD